jgi:hypothetical protein
MGDFHLPPFQEGRTKQAHPEMNINPLPANQVPFTVGVFGASAIVAEYSRSVLIEVGRSRAPAAKTERPREVPSVALSPWQAHKVTFGLGEPDQLEAHTVDGRRPRQSTRAASTLPK